MATYEIEIRTTLQTLDVGPPGAAAMANLEVYNGKIGPIIPNDFPAIPGPLNPGDELIVRLINDMPIPTGIHWHGIELQSNADGTPVTQDALPGGDLQVLGGEVDPVGGTYLYKFRLPRPGIFWFHPHHFHSTNRVFRGSYGMIVVTDPNEAALIPSVLPDASQTERIILSDITVCKVPGSNTPYDPALPWVGGGSLPPQPGLTPEQLCSTAPVDEQGSPLPAGTTFNAADVPRLQRASQRINEGLTVLTNGRNVGGRAGTPTSPGLADAMASMINVQPGHGLRLQMVNCATTRYFRLILTTETGTKLNLVRVGGEGGLLDNALLEGGSSGGLDMNYTEGEILIPPAARADVVVAIPSDATGTLTMWTQDFPRLAGVGSGGWADLPTVPVLHLNVTGAPIVPAYTITGAVNGVGGTPLRASLPGQEVETLGPATATLLDPATFAKPGFSPTPADPDIQNIKLTNGPPGVNGTLGSFPPVGSQPYTSALHIGSSRYAKEGDILELRITNTTNAHHPFHLHGFSFQPISLTPRVIDPGDPPAPPGGLPTETYTWPYREFRDTVNIPNEYTLTLRVRIESGRVLNDGTTLGGALGRWLFHCHIFFHAHRGMISELVITDPDGSGDEKPNIDVGGSWTYAPSGMPATRFGTYFLPDADTLTSIVAHLDDGTPIGDITVGSGTWTWASHTSPNPPLPDQTTYVYVTITGASGRQDQTVFRLQLGGTDDGSDNGDPHIRTVDGQPYDFQAVGEFVLLRDRLGMEVQTRQTPVLTANPITDSYTGLRACVSLNTAVAARVGSHRIAYQPGAQPGELEFFVDGKRSRLPARGIDLDGHRVTTFDADGATGLRVDYVHHAVLAVTPRFWNSHGLWYMNVSVSRTQGEEGLMGPLPTGSWLPRLSSGAEVGPMPRALAERHRVLYETFADSWRVTQETSLFVYAPGASTATFTDKDWPAAKPPCALKPQFELPGVAIPNGMGIDEARQICKAVTEDDLHADCVFDVATTGDETFAKGYLLQQELRLRGTAVHVAPEKPNSGGRPDLVAVGTVAALRKKQPVPRGALTFFVDDQKTSEPTPVDAAGRARFEARGLLPGSHKIRAEYKPADAKDGYLPSSSANWIHLVEPSCDEPHEPIDLRVVLEKIQVLDDRDLFGKGEVWFETRVRTRFGSGNEVRRRVPETGYFSVSDKPGCNVIDLGVEIFRGKASGELVVQIRGGEHDWLTRDDPLGVYTRRFEGAPEQWLGRYAPDDEPLDSEDVGLWRVTYRVERA